MRTGRKRLYFVVTATLKSNTLELFGRKDENGKHRAFHNYTMRRATEGKGRAMVVTRSRLHAVQTLSRLNRTYRGKDDAVILDFVNEAEGIETAFQPYYQKTIVEEGVDPQTGKQYPIRNPGLRRSRLFPNPENL